VAAAVCAIPKNVRPVAQLVEWRSPKPQVGGSRPSWPANIKIEKMINRETEEKKSKNSGLLGWGLTLVLTLLAFFVTYYYQFSGPIQVLVWLGWLVLALLSMYITPQGQEVFLFAQESKVEMQKVVWPSRQETVQTTLIVVAMVAVTGFVLWAVDLSMMWIIGKITHLG
jgi:preprotein translocase subunit SecE